MRDQVVGLRSMRPAESISSRVAQRHKIFQPTRMCTSSGEERVHLINISTMGALVHFPAPPAKGSRIGISINDRIVAAHVVWARGARFGITFAPPLDEHALAAFIR